MKTDNWTILIEGMGPTHNGKMADANNAMLKAIEWLRDNHDILQARFTTCRGEENWCDLATLDMHVKLYAEADEDLHKQLVQLGLEASEDSKDAAREQGPTEMGIRESEQKHSRGKSRSGVYLRDT